MMELFLKKAQSLMFGKGLKYEPVLFFYHTANFRKQRFRSILRILQILKFLFEISYFRYKHLTFSPLKPEFYLAAAKTFDIINHFNKKLAGAQKKERNIVKI